MTKLPERNILDASMLPKTTTGEMKEAFGQLRDFLARLLGDDSSDKEAPRLSPGIDLDGLNGCLSGKAERTELAALQDEIGKRGVPIGSIDYVATTTPPTGYLKADGAAVGRETYPDMFASIGTIFGEGDGSTTFNLPDLMGRFPEGHDLPGMVKEAGLPNVTGNMTVTAYTANTSEAFFNRYINQANAQMYESTGGGFKDTGTGFNASRSNPVYGASDTVQPHALTLLPCVKAFDALVNPGLIDIAELANEIAAKESTTTRLANADAGYDKTPSYVRFSNGMQICWEYHRVEQQIQSVTFPVAFAYAPNVLTTVRANLAAGGEYTTRVLTYPAYFDITAICNTSVVTGVSFSYTAFGQWK